MWIALKSAKRARLVYQSATVLLWEYGASGRAYIGDTSKLREERRAAHYQAPCGKPRRGLGNDRGYGKNVPDMSLIRSQAPKAPRRYGEGSTTRHSWGRGASPEAALF